MNTKPSWPSDMKIIKLASIYRATSVISPLGYTYSTVIQPRNAEGGRRLLSSLNEFRNIEYPPRGLNVEHIAGITVSAPIDSDNAYKSITNTVSTFTEHLKHKEVFNNLDITLSPFRYHNTVGVAIADNHRVEINAYALAENIPFDHLLSHELAHILVSNLASVMDASDYIRFKAEMQTQFEKLRGEEGGAFLSMTVGQNLEEFMAEVIASITTNTVNKPQNSLIDPREFGDILDVVRDAREIARKYLTDHDTPLGELNGGTRKTVLSVVEMEELLSVYGTIVDEERRSMEFVRMKNGVYLILIFIGNVIAIRHFSVIDNCCEEWKKVRRKVEYLSPRCQAKLSSPDTDITKPPDLSNACSP